MVRAAFSAALFLAAPAPGSLAQTLPCPAPGDFDCDGVHDLADNCFRIRNADQRDLDADGEGDVCDEDDGLILADFFGERFLHWQPEPSFDGFNVYRADLFALRGTGQYTQDPLESPTGIPERFCGRWDSTLEDPFLIFPGEVPYYLVAGIRNGLEESLGTNSAGVERPNDHPCETNTIGPLRSIVRTDLRTYSPDEAVQVEVEFINVDAPAVTLTFSSGCQADFQVHERRGRLVYDNRNHHACPDIVTSLTLPPGGSQTYNLTWLQQDDAGRPLPPGDYLLRSFSYSDQQLPRPGSRAITLQRGPVFETLVKTDRSVYNSGEPVGIALSARNAGDAPGTLTFPSCLGHFEVENASGNIVYDNRFAPGNPTCSVLPVVREEQVATGESLDLAFTWNQRDYAGNLVPVNQTYRIRGIFDSDEPLPPASTPLSIVSVIGPLLKPSVSTDLDAYPAGEPVLIDYSITNAGDATATLSLGGCGAFFLVRDALGATLWDESRHQICPAVFYEQPLEPGQTLNFPFSWNQMSETGVQVPAGAEYTILGTTDPPQLGTAAEKRIRIFTSPIFEAHLLTDLDWYPAGQPVEIRLSVWNGSPEVQTLAFRDSCEAWFVVEDRHRNVIYDARAHRTCLFVLSSVTLQPGQSEEWSFRWTQVDDGGAPVRLDDYTLRGFYDGFDQTRQTAKLIRIVR